MTGFFTLELSTLYFELEVEISEENPPQKTTDSIPLQHCEEIAVAQHLSYYFRIFSLRRSSLFSRTKSDTF